MVLVCTHGTRDTCCAVRGRPIVAILARALPEQVWECTHLGGHRFAGTLLSLPDGACFGRLDPDSAVEVVRAHRQGRTDPAHLRGTTRWEPAVQAALVAALEASGPASADDAVPGAVEVDGDRTTVEVIGAGRCPSGSSSTSSPRRCRMPRSAAATGPRRTSRSAPPCARRFRGGPAVAACGDERDGAVPRGT